MLTPSELAERFPYAHYHPEWRLVTWHPDGVLDNERVDRAVEFLEMAEKFEGESFDRFIDMSGYSEIQVDLDHLVRVARRRRGYRGRRVKLAFYAMRLISLAIARLYQEVLMGSRLEVAIFRDRAVAAKWLGVPESILQKPKRHLV
jgi:hypothetical protein